MKVQHLPGVDPVHEVNLLGLGVIKQVHDSLRAPVYGAGVTHVRHQLAALVRQDSSSNHLPPRKQKS